MNNFKNLKIAITDETHLKAVCDVLESMGYSEGLSLDYVGSDQHRYIMTHDNGVYAYYCHYDESSDYLELTLSDLLKMRDDTVKANAKSS
ncbi:MAG: hypothetical protein RR676_11460 [Acinetobacter sp.]